MSMRIVVFVLSVLAYSCSPGAGPEPAVTSSIDKVKSLSEAGSYNLQSPDSTFILDSDLKEISGLAYDSADNTLLAVDDESGYYYHLSVDDGKVIRKVKFHKKGDYEAIAYLESKVVVAKSSGNLYMNSDSSANSIVLKNQLKSKNDVEGLVYVADENSLLIACKGSMMEQGDNKNAKGIYKYSLRDNVLSDEPYLIIPIDDIETFIISKMESKSKFALKKITNRLRNFAPSGIAIHPSDKDMYIISARGSILVIYDQYLKLKDVVLLNDKTVPQPEGICFDYNNNLYISTEGQGFSGKIFKYLAKDID